MNNFDIIVVGCGLAGATAAAILSQRHKVLVVENKKHIGGQIYDYRNEEGILVHKYGPHIFHTTNAKIWQFVNNYSEFSNYQHRVLSFANGQFIKFPINRDTLKQVFGISLTNDKVNDYLKLLVDKSDYDKSLPSFRDKVISQVGEELYKLFFESYTAKQWNCDPATLSSDLAGRIPVRTNNDDRYFTDRYQGMPVLGYTAMVEKMLNHQNISILLGCDYNSIKDHCSPKLVVYTGELDRFFDFKYGKLEYRSVKIDFKTYDMPSFQPAPVVNYPNDYDYTRITEFKKMTGDQSQKTTVCYEYPSAEGLPFYTIPNKRNNEMREVYMNEVAKLEQSGKYLFVGRLAEYKYYNMDKVIESVIDKITKWEN